MDKYLKIRRVNTCITDSNRCFVSIYQWHDGTLFGYCAGKSTYNECVECAYAAMADLTPGEYIIVGDVDTRREYITITAEEL